MIGSVSSVLLLGCHEFGTPHVCFYPPLAKSQLD